LLPVSVLGGAPAEQGFAIERVTVIDAVHGVRADQRVVVKGDAIVAVAPMTDPAPAVAQTLDGAGRFLIPGLWDMHVHFLYDESLTEAMPGLFLEHGITSVRDTGGNIERLAALRSALEASSEPAPRIFISGPLQDGEHVVYDGGDPGRPPLGTRVPSVEAASRSVAALEAAGADFVKIYELVQPDVFRALVFSARERHLPIAAHVPLTMTADEAGPLVDSMEHLRNVELACAEEWQALLEERRERIAGFDDGRGYDLRSEIHRLQRLPAITTYVAARCDQVLETLTDTIQVPTLRLNAFDLARPDRRDDWAEAFARLPAETREAWRPALDRLTGPSEADIRFAEWSLFLTGRMHERDVPIGAGTDTPITYAIPGYSLHTELELLVESGLSPMEALHAATVQPARFFGLTGELGCIEPGQRADLVLLRTDPLEDIRHTRAIDGVMSRGRWVVGPRTRQEGRSG